MARDIVLDCVNQSSVVPAAEFQAWLAAQQKQIDNDFAPEWDAPCRITSSQLETVPADAWQLLILDEPGPNEEIDSHALGYHKVDGTGQPLARIFAKKDVEKGLKWTVTASHEVLETLADPDINRTVVLPSPPGSLGGIWIFAYEVCDAVEADALAREIDGVWLSDFVTRKWFQLGSTGQMDAYGFVKRPLDLAPGGYIGVMQVIQGGPIIPWHPIFGQGATEAQMRHPDFSPRRAFRFAQVQ